MWIYHQVLNPSLTKGYLGCFPLEAIIRSSMRCLYTSFWLNISFLWDKGQRVLLGHITSMCSFYIPTRKLKWSHFFTSSPELSAVHVTCLSCSGGCGWQLIVGYFAFPDGRQCRGSFHVLVLHLRSLCTEMSPARFITGLFSVFSFETQCTWFLSHSAPSFHPLNGAFGRAKGSDFEKVHLISFSFYRCSVQIQELLLSPRSQRWCLFLPRNYIVLNFYALGCTLHAHELEMESLALSVDA